MLQGEIISKIDQIDIPEILSDLVSIPSYESEQQVVEYITRRLNTLDVEYETTDVAPSRQNLIAYAGEGGKTLIFNSHMDTVPPGSIGNWVNSPFKLTKRGDKLFGLGACDAKGCLASMLAAFELIARHSHILKGRLILQSVCCEETRARGTLAEVKRGISADAAIIGEPTDLIPRVGHKGGLGMEIAIFGKAAHGSAPEEGINAISKMMWLIRQLEILADEISARKDPTFGSPSLVVTQISGGQAPNVIPDKCSITLDRRLIPGENILEAIDEISAVIESEKIADSSLSVSVKQKIGIEPCAVSLEEPILKEVERSIAQIKGKEQKATGFPACCDMWCLVENAGIPTVILGPGDLSLAHKANEYVTVDAIYDAAKIYAAIAINWLNS
jgi:acetylornithine deacetylase/succinyl-diaminopimelate desuccinylase family protein